MTTAILVSPIAQEIPRIADAIYIGVDAGLLKILEAGLCPSLAIGDFDSMDEEQFERIKHITKIEKHPIMKDESDMELGLRIVSQMGCDPIYLVGAAGARIDHTIANLRLLMYHYPQAILWEVHQRVRILQEGKHKLKNDFRNVSFFAIVPSILTLHGFLYPLEHRELEPKDIYTLSNSIESNDGEVIVESGRILCIETND